MVRKPREKPGLRLELDFAKYGLAFLKTTPVSDWQEGDIERLIDAFAAESIAPAIYGLAFTLQNVQGLLSLSHCRRCGRCCLPNPCQPEHPGVLVSEWDLRRIAENSLHTYRSLKRKAPMSLDPAFIRGRYLPLPCMFYDKEKGECRIYHSRPLVCATFPVTDIPGRAGVAVNVGCDYGKDIYRAVLTHLKKATAGDRSVIPAPYRSGVHRERDEVRQNDGLDGISTGR